MESSINLYHDKNLIETISDERLFKKQEIVENNNVVTKWVQIPNTLYKLEKSNPTSSLGVSGDYCAKYVRRYNNFKYSESFTANTTNNLWNSYYCSFNTSTNNPSFPYSPSKKMKGLTSFKKHYFQYKIDNQDVPYTFSIYAKPDEIKTFKIGLYNENFSQGVELKIAFDEEYNESHTMSYTTNHSNVTYYNIFITQVDEKKHIYRVGISAKILQTPYVYARVMLIHNTMEEFKMNTDSQGMYFNAAQLTNNTDSLDEYIKTYGFIKSSLTLDKLYKRGNSNWSVVQNTNLYYLSNEMEIIRVNEDEYDVKYYLDGADDIGNIGDIATITPILNINPFIRVGDNTNTKTIDDKMSNPIAYMYYNSDDGHYYIKTKKSTSVIKVSENPPINHIMYSDCRLMYDDQKPDNNAIVHAILYNQQTYQHYTRCSYFGRGASHRYGIGTSGYLNFYGNPLQRNRGF